MAGREEHPQFIFSSVPLLVPLAQLGFVLAVAAAW